MCSFSFLFTKPTCGSAAPFAEWSWSGSGPAGQEVQWDAAMWWFCSRGPRRRSFRGCRSEPPSLRDIAIIDTQQVFNVSRGQKITGS